MGEVEDDDLTEAVKAVLADERESLDRLCDIVRPRLVRHVEASMPVRARRLIEAEDVIQHVLSDLAADPGKFLDAGDPGRTERLLRKRADWRLLDVIRAHGKSRGESEIGAGSMPAATAPTTGPVTGNDDRRWLRELIEHLHGRPRDVVMLCGLEGHSYASAAEVLGTSPDSVRKAYERAGEALREAAARQARERERRLNDDPALD